MQEMVIYGVSFDMVGKQPIVLLKTVESNKFLPIWIGHPEAAAILMKLQGASTPRPMTHDLLSEMLGELEVECTRVAVTELRENTFYASITISVNGSEIEIDSRPSDAIALAVRCQAPIFAAEEVIDESSIEFEHEVEDQEEVVERFKEPMLQESLTGVFPTDADDQSKTRFSINFFTAIGMGVLTEGMRDWLKNSAPKPKPLPEPESESDDSRSVSSRSSYTSSSYSRSRSPVRRRRDSRSRSRSKRRRR